MGGYLRGTRVYLSGPIQFDSLPNWREQPKKTMIEKFGVHLFDPLDDPKQQWVPKLNAARDCKDYHTMADIAKRFVRKDLAMVDRADFVIAFVPHKIPTTGVCHEVINSNNAKKPTLLVTNCNDVGYIPIWYFGFISLEFMFPNWDSLFAYLEDVDAGKHKHNNRWGFIYGEI